MCVCVYTYIYICKGSLNNSKLCNKQPWGFWHEHMEHMGRVNTYIHYLVFLLCYYTINVLLLM